MMAGACSADEPAAPPDVVDPPPAPDREPHSSLARRIAPLLALPDLEPIAEGFPAVGVAACDRYLRNYLRCVEQTMSATSIAAVRKGLMDAGRTWRTLRDGPGGRDAVVQTCQLTEKVGRELASSLHCPWE